jgi:hypothetical protein
VAGRWELLECRSVDDDGAITGRPDRIIHYVDSSLVPGWAGMDQVRYFSLSDDVLVLRTPPMELAGAVTVSELSWRRAESW